MIATEISNAWRELRAHPAAALLVVGVLALGLGCMLFVAGIVNGVIVKPLPFANPDQLLDAGLIDNDDAPDTTRFDAIDAEQLLQWREHVGDLAQVAGVSRRTLNLSDGQRPERFDGAAVTANLFGVLGAKPMLGRGFAQADEQPGAPPVVVLHLLCYHLPAVALAAVLPGPAGALQAAGDVHGVTGGQVEAFS